MYELRFLIDEYQKREQNVLKRFLLRRLEARQSVTERIETLEFINGQLAVPTAPLPDALNMARLHLTEDSLNSRFGGSVERGSWSVLLSAGSRRSGKHVAEMEPEEIKALMDRAESLLTPALDALHEVASRDLARSHRSLYTMAALPFARFLSNLNESLPSDNSVPCLFGLIRQKPGLEEQPELIAAIRAQQEKSQGPELIRQLAWIPTMESLEALTLMAASGKPEIERAAAHALEGFADLPFMRVAEILAAKRDAWTLLHLAESLGNLKAAEAVPLLQKILKVVDSEFIHYHCLQAVASIGGDESKPLLIEGLKSTSESVRAVALEGLVVNGLAGEFSTKLVEKFIRVDRPFLMLAAHLCQVHLDREKGFTALMDLLSRADEMAQQVGLYGLRYFRGDPIIKAMGAFTAKPVSSASSVLAIEVLSRQEGDPKALAVLAPMFEIDHPEIRGKAFRAAGRIAAGKEPALDTAMRIRELVKTEQSPVVRREMALALGELGRGTQGEVGDALVELACSDNDVGVRLAAVEQCELLADIPEKLLSVVGLNVNPLVQATLAGVLWTHGNAQSVQIIDSLLRDMNRKKRDAAFEVLEKVGLQLSLLPVCPGLSRLKKRLRPPTKLKREPRKPDHLPEAACAILGPVSVAAILENGPAAFVGPSHVPSIVPAIPKSQGGQPARRPERNTVRIGPRMMNLKQEPVPPEGIAWKKVALIGVGALILFVALMSLVLK